MTRSLLVAGVAMFGSAVLGVTTTLAAEVALNAAVTPLVVPGTGTPNPKDSDNYMGNAVAYYVEPGGTCGADGCTTPVPVPYIAQFWPFPFPGWGGLQGAKWNVSVASGVTSLTSQLVGSNNPTDDHPVIVFGYSQGATVAGIVKGQLADLPTDQKDDLTFVLIGDPNRPNGGLFERLAMLGTVPVLDATFGQPTPTDTGITTYDIALQYDGVSDAPSWVLNPLAMANALAGFGYVHGTYLAPDGTDPASATPYGYTPEQVQAAVANAKADCSEATHCQQEGDTYYITLPAKYLPIMQPLLDLGAATGTSEIVVPVVNLISPTVQTLIETGYDRSDYGTPTPFQLVPKINPVTLAVDLVNDIPEGIAAASQPGLAPLPGWTDPTQTVITAPTTTDTAPAPITATSTPDVQKVTATTDLKPSPRLSAIAKPTKGATGTAAAATQTDRPSLRKTLGVNEHPVHDLAKSLGSTVRKSLGQDGTKVTPKSSTGIKTTHKDDGGTKVAKPAA
ncbi:PE-PPE domain-containing protein [Mycobacterium sp. 141]|uniref:PE-PPE domain-containing protein n=1 Tax=Mycobacterium sp. 141 TaxID=1120797 RepID=UPI00037F381B|nr:PE-PPE domain-containing protein [Mycobacterium sp. 141]